MRRYVTADTLAGVVVLVLAVGVCVPVLMGIGSTNIPLTLWTGVFVVFLLACLASVLAMGPVRRWQVAALVLSVLSSWVLILTSNVELVMVLVSFTAAMSAYVVPRWCTAAIIALNTTVVVVSGAMSGAAWESGWVFAGFYLLIQLAVVFSTVSWENERKARVELAEAHVDLRAASVLLENSTRAEERLRISRELHDLIGHQLAVLTLHLEAARHLDGEKARESVGRADAVARDLLRDVRATVGELRAESSDLKEALGRVAEGLPGLDVELHIDEGVDLTEEQAHAAIRFAQETMTNSVRHGEGEHLTLDLSREEDRYLMVAADDGYGEEDPVLGNGLRGLQERFEALGGELAVDGSDGFRVTGTVPAMVPAVTEVAR